MSFGRVAPKQGRASGDRPPCALLPFSQPDEGFMAKWIFLSVAAVVAITISVWLVRANHGSSPNTVELLNVSYDPTRELWRDLNAKFIPRYDRQTGVHLTIDQSHGGSATQALAIIDGLDADVVTLALWSDTDAIRKAGLIRDGWQERLPDHSLPYFSTIVFVVRKGNPRASRTGRTWCGRASRSLRPTRRPPATAGSAFWRPGARSSTRGGSRGRGPRVRHQALPPRPRARHRGPRRDDHVRPEEDRRRASDLGERRLPGSSGDPGRAGDRLSAAEHSSRAVRGRGRRQRRSQGHAGRRRGVPAVILYTDEAQEIIAQPLLSADQTEVLKKHADSVPAGGPVSDHDARQGAGTRPQQTFFASGASSTDLQTSAGH